MYRRPCLQSQGDTPLNLEVFVKNSPFKNPLVLASGTFGYGLTFSNVIEKAGAFVTKGISVKPKKGNPPPRIWDSVETVINSVGLENVGLEEFKTRILPSIRFSTPLYVNLAGVDEDEFGILIETLEDSPGISGYELNLSCPNVKEGGAALGQSVNKVAKVTTLCRSLTSRPIWVKLTTNFCDVRETSKAAADSGADAVVLINTLNALVVDAKRRRPFLGSGSGGLSGPAIKPYVLYLVREVSKRIRIPIVASGGAVCGQDVRDFMLSGASLVELGSINLVNPESLIRILKEFEECINSEGIASPSELIGRLEER